MLTWLYDIFVAIVSFVMSFFGFDLKKRSVTFASDVKEEEEEKKEEDKNDNDKSDEVVAPQAIEGSVAVAE
jgi:hypothetical protein